jgi:hypothetical protein
MKEIGYDKLAPMPTKTKKTPEQRLLRYAREVVVIDTNEIAKEGVWFVAYFADGQRSYLGMSEKSARDMLCRIADSRRGMW